MEGQHGLINIGVLSKCSVSAGRDVPARHGPTSKLQWFGPLATAVRASLRFLTHGWSEHYFSSGIQSPDNGHCGGL